MQSFKALQIISNRGKYSDIVIAQSVLQLSAGTPCTVLVTHAQYKNKPNQTKKKPSWYRTCSKEGLPGMSGFQGLPHKKKIKVGSLKLVIQSWDPFINMLGGINSTEGEKLVQERLNMSQRICGYKIALNILRVQVRFLTSRAVRPGAAGR